MNIRTFANVQSRLPWSLLVTFIYQRKFFKGACDGVECEFSAVIVSVPVSFLLALLLCSCIFHCYTLGLIVSEDVVCGEFVSGGASPGTLSKAPIETLDKAVIETAKLPLKHYVRLPLFLHSV
ncbi:hypothetical protein BsWGS_11891 [Bradybaena similaris]